jgi:hypothetical protein
MFIISLSARSDLIFSLVLKAENPCHYPFLPQIADRLCCDCYMAGKSRAEDLLAELTVGGEAAIDRFISERRSEELFIDYKKSADDGIGTKLHHIDRGNLAKAVSGFGNSEGGLVIWGVTCQQDPVVGDVPTGKVPVSNPKRFVSWLEGAVSGCTLPPHIGVRNHAIEEPTGTKGYAITFVPKSTLAPHQCIVEPYRYRYYLRAGSNFEQVPHGVLAGMFGQQPAPSVYHMWGLGGRMPPTNDDSVIRLSSRPTETPYVWLQIMLVNNGVVMARDLYVNFRMAGPGGNGEWALRKPSEAWQVVESIGGWHAVAEDKFKLAPSACICALSVLLYLKPPFPQDLWYEVTLGCSGAPVQMFERTIPHTDVEQAYLRFMSGDCGKQAGFKLAQSVFGIGDEPNVQDAEE